ncbi:MAG: fumarylacetoacetate hydrolase family protein [Ectothiorhodospiraceae bacterium AqS1]|nr:fumarylacetoacetate hydrolase family protein [Ectothiorhodospiraceae bacterium AqS1]
MNHVFPPCEAASLAVADSDLRFPVRRVYCVGRNYAAHTREMGHDPDREAPFFFQKNPDSLLRSGSILPYPPATEALHFEIELVCALGRGGAQIPADRALEHVWGYAVGIDMTRRDLQGEAKKLGRPWETGKSFDHAAPCSKVHPVERIGHPATGRIWLEVNGSIRQDGDLAELIWPVAGIIEQLSSLFTLAAGDLIFTGTPAGVGAVKRGDTMVGGVEGVDEIRIEVG